MSGPDYRMQQECEEERMFMLLTILRRVANGLSNEKDAVVLASELGLTTYAGIIQSEREHYEME